MVPAQQSQCTRCPTLAERVNHPDLAARNQLRASERLHEHVCALNSQVLDREWGSPQFCEHHNHQNKLLTPGKRGV